MNRAAWWGRQWSNNLRLSHKFKVNPNYDALFSANFRFNAVSVSSLDNYKMVNEVITFQLGLLQMD